MIPAGLWMAALLFGPPVRLIAEETLDRAQAFEVSARDLDLLPRGKEADGIAGDFVLRNGFIEGLVSGNLPNRKANMTTNSLSSTPGCLYDLAVRGSGNDQLTCLAPAGLSGLLSSVRVTADGSDPRDRTACVRAERTAALGQGLAEVHEYRLAPGWRHLLILSTYENRRSEPLEVKPAAVWKGLSGELDLRKVRAADAMDPMDRQAYAVAAIPWEGTPGDDGPFTLRPGEKRTVALAVAPGRSPAEAFGVVGSLRWATGTLRGRVTGRGGAGIRTAAVEVPLDGKLLLAYPDQRGDFQLQLPPGDYELAARDIGRPTVRSRVTVKPDTTAEVRLEMAAESRIAFEISGPGGENLPVKVQIIGLGATLDPELGPVIRAHGCKNQYHSETGWFTVAVPPGRYRVVATHGIEFDHHQAEVEVAAGREARVAATLRRVVDTRGWISTDFHNHSTPSGDNYCGTDDRLINLAAEGVEFAPTTEHNRFYDWTPHLARLGLSGEIATAVGIELTGPGAHLNAFPMRVIPGVQDGGAPGWSSDPRINAIVLRDWGGGGPERWVQLNHPAVGEFFRDRNADGVPDGGFPELERYVDATEVWSAEILNPTPVLTDVDRTTGMHRRIQNRTFAWLQLLNQGRRMWCIAVSDAHAVFDNGVGGWRSYVPSSSDVVQEIDPREIVRNARAGRLVVTNGPFLEARLADGTLPGGLTVSAGGADLHVRVQTTTWLDIDRVQVLVNGRARPELNFTRGSRPDLFSRSPAERVRFEQDIHVPLLEDAWIIVVAFGEGSDLKTGYGRSWEGAMHPCAYHNPIYVDVDGNGFRPSGDTLGYPLPVAFPLRRKF